MLIKEQGTENSLLFYYLKFQKKCKKSSKKSNQKIEGKTTLPTVTR